MNSTRGMRRQECSNEGGEECSMERGQERSNERGQECSLERGQEYSNERGQERSNERGQERSNERGPHRNYPYRRRDRTRWGVSPSSPFPCSSYHRITGEEEMNRGTASHQLSATALLSPNDTMRHPIEVYDFTDDDFGGIRFRGRRGGGARGSHGCWNCFISCRHRIDHQLGKKVVQQGLKLYDQHKHQAAVRKWKFALRKIRTRDDKFYLLGYLFQAYMDWGKYGESMNYAHKQLIISEEIDDDNMRTEAYLHLALAHERMGVMERALAFSRYALQNRCTDTRIAGLVQITLGNVYLEMAHFCKSLSAFQSAYKLSLSVADSKLELQVYIGLSELFGRLQDVDKSAEFASRAYDLSRSLQSGDLNTRHHRAALLQMASSLCKQGELGDANDYCGEASKFALVSGDQASYVRSVRIMGDIYRKKSEINKAFRQYESAINTSMSMGDRVCQMQAMDGAAKCLEALRLQQKICNCRPLEFNNKLLELVNVVGAKLLARTVRLRLMQIYGCLKDEHQQLLHERMAKGLEEEMDIICVACDQQFGLEAGSLEALPCSHILHAKCVSDMGRSKSKKKKRNCPDCQEPMNVYDDEEAGPSGVTFPKNPPAPGPSRGSTLPRRGSNQSQGHSATSSV